MKRSHYYNGHFNTIAMAIACTIFSAYSVAEALATTINKKHYKQAHSHDNVQSTSTKAIALEENKDNSNVFTLGTLTVYGTAITAAEEAESKIDRDKINLFEKKDVGTALSKVPGVIYNYAQGGRYESNIMVRGYGLRYMPIYIDGIPVYIPYDGYSDIGRFTTADISSIQVAKGYSSVMYGHNTMGGAINIVTMRPRSALDVTSTVGYGQGASIERHINIGSLQDKWYIQTGVSNLTSRYTRLAKHFKGLDARDQLVNSNKYAYTTKDQRASIKLGFIPNQTDEYVVSYSNQKAKKYPSTGVGGFKPTTWEWPKWDRETLSFVSNTRFYNDSFYIKPRLYEDLFKNTLIGWRGSLNGSNYDDKAFGASLELGTEIINNNLLKLLLSYKRETHNAFDTYPKTSQKIANTQSNATQKFYSIALEDTITFTEQWEAQIGIIHTMRKAKATAIGVNTQAIINRYPEVNSMLAPTIRATDPQMALFYKPTTNHTFRASVAHKTRFPNFKEAYSNYASSSTTRCPARQKGCRAGQIIPRLTLQNPGLRPEQAMNYELGYVGYPIADMKTEATLFLNQAKDAISRTAIDYNTYPGFAITQTTNLSETTQRKGFELATDYTINHKLLIGGTYTYLTTKNHSDTNQHLADIPKHYGTLYAVISPSDWLKIIPTIDARSNSYYSTTGKEKNKGYALYGLKFSYNPTSLKYISFNVGIENMFNKDYSKHNADYASPGRYIYTNMRLDYY